MAQDYDYQDEKGSGPGSVGNKMDGGIWTEQRVHFLRYGRQTKRRILWVRFFVATTTAQSPWKSDML